MITFKEQHLQKIRTISANGDNLEIDLSAPLTEHAEDRKRKGQDSAEDLKTI